jgi:hypothetical protein
MSLSTIPTGYLPLAQACGPKHAIEAVCTESVALIGELTWFSNTDNYELYTSTCPYVAGGSNCGTAGGSSGRSPTHGAVAISECPTVIGAATANALIGTKGTAAVPDGSLNSTLTITNDGAAFVIDHITIEADEQIGANLESDEVGMTLGYGHGTYPPWEAFGIEHTWIAERQLVVVRVTVDGVASSNVRLCDGEGVWIPEPDYQIANVPVSVSIDEELGAKIVPTGATIVLRPFLTASFGAGAETAMTLIFSSWRIEIWGSPA